MRTRRLRTPNSKPRTALLARAVRQNPQSPVLLFPPNSELRIPNCREVATCIGCGCTDDHACDTVLGPCFWIKVDYKAGIGVCSECGHKLEEYEKRMEQSSGRKKAQEAQGVNLSNLEKTCGGPEVVE